MSEIQNMNKKGKLLDGYECFGWKLDEKLAENKDNPAYQKKTVLCLK